MIQDSFRQVCTTSKNISLTLVSKIFLYKQIFMELIRFQSAERLTLILSNP